MSSTTRRNKATPPAGGSAPVAEPPRAEETAADGPKDPRELPRYSTEWWKEWAIVLLVFSITGSSSVKFTKPLVIYLVGAGTFFGGPWYYTLTYLLCTMPICGFYSGVSLESVFSVLPSRFATDSMILITIGSLFGRGKYFRKVTKRMYGRFLPAKARDMLG